MASDNLAGIGITLAAGVIGGSALVPIKFVRRWKWENTWLLYACCAYLVFPWVVALLTVPRLGQVYGDAGWGVVLASGAFGLGWGLAVVLYGVALDMVGLSLTSAIIYGSSIVAGSLVPMLLLDAGSLSSSAGLGLIAADAVMLGGVLLCAWAGDLREKKPAVRVWGSRARRGIALCFVAGLTSTLINIALAYARPLEQHAVAHGAQPFFAANAVWALVASFGAQPSIWWCAWKLGTKRTWSSYGAPGSGVNAGWCMLMGAAWISGTVLYGAGAGRLGGLGPAVGWPVYMSGMILTGNAWGWWTGEWRGAPARAVRVMVAGIALQVAAIAVLGQVR